MLKHTPRYIYLLAVEDINRSLAEIAGERVKYKRNLYAIHNAFMVSGVPECCGIEDNLGYIVKADNSRAIAEINTSDFNKVAVVN